jgi:hypothetical protein
MFPVSAGPLSFFMVGRESSGYPGGSKPVEDQKMPLITREFGLALKVH